MQPYYKILLLALLLPLATIAGPIKGKYIKKKSLKKAYTVNNDAMLLLDNKYGSMTITTWNQPKVEIEIYVEVSGDDEGDVEEKLHEIDVNFDSSASHVSVKTMVNNKRENWSWSNWFSSSSNKKVNVEINYRVKMPITNNLDARNDYGTLSLDKLIGQARLNCDHGKMIIDSLLHEDNYIKMDFTTNKSRLGYIKSATINAKVNNLDVNADYGSVTVGETSDLIGRGDYVTLKIGTIKNLLDLNTDYGTISVSRLKTGFKEINLRSDATGIKIYYEATASFDFTIDTEFAGISISDGATITRSDNNHVDRLKSGFNGNQNSGNNIDIKTSYGIVKLIEIND